MKYLSLFLLVALAFGADPNKFESRKQSIRDLLDRKNFSLALEQAKQLNHDWMDDVPTYQLLAAAQLGMGEYSAAEKSMQWMLDLREGKSDSQGWLLLAQFREVTGDLEGAIEASNLAHAQLPLGDTSFRRRLLAYSGHLQLAAGHTRGADALLTEALKSWPDDAGLLQGLADVRLAQHKNEEAVAILKGLSDLRSMYRLATLTGDYSEFERQARERETKFDNDNRELVLYYSGPGKNPKEAERLATFESGRRHDVFTLDALAVALRANGKNTQAQAIMKDVLATGNRESDILKHAEQIGVTHE